MGELGRRRGRQQPKGMRRTAPPESTAAQLGMGSMQGAALVSGLDLVARKQSLPASLRRLLYQSQRRNQNLGLDQGRMLPV